MRYIKETDEVEFTVTMLGYAWFGLVLGDANMAFNADMLIFSSHKGTEYNDVMDYHSVGF